MLKTNLLIRIVNDNKTMEIKRLRLLAIKVRKILMAYELCSYMKTVFVLKVNSKLS